MYLRISFLLFLIQQCCHSQVQISIPIDTLKSTYSTLGNIDTMDYNSIYFSSSFPLISLHNRFGLPSIDLLDVNSSIYSSIQKKRTAFTLERLKQESNNINSRAYQTSIFMADVMTKNSRIYRVIRENLVAIS
jgi:hypothetical protein